MARNRRTSLPTPPAGRGYEFEIVHLKATESDGPTPAVKTRGGLIPVGNREIDTGKVQTRIENCSDGVAVIVPAALAAQAGLSAGPVELELTAGRVVVSPVGGQTLVDLLAGITPENLHGES